VCADPRTASNQAAARVLDDSDWRSSSTLLAESDDRHGNGPEAVRFAQTK
jgi:hypothetical protein